MSQTITFATTTPTAMIRRPETPEQAVSESFTGTAFGFYWENGVPHADVPDTLCEGYESGERHYILVPVTLATVIASL